MPRPRPVTPTQRKVLETIVSYQRRNGFPPTQRELCQLLGVTSTSTVYSHLSALERKGLFARRSASPRAISVVQANANEEENP